MDITQSFLLSVTRVRLSLYEQRLLTKIVENGQSELAGRAISRDLSKWHHNLKNIKLEIPVRYVLSDGSHHYDAVYDAVRSLERRVFEFYDPQKKVWFSSPIIYNAIIRKSSGMVSFYVSSVLYDVMFDFRLGFCKYDLDAALKLQSPYAVRMYVLLNNQSRPLRIDVDRLKEMFGVADKYAQTADFIKKVIEPSRKALDELGVNSFTYSREKEGLKVTRLMFFPVKNIKEEQKVWQNLGRENIMLYKAVYMYMQEYGKFTIKELHVHQKLLMKYAQIPDCIQRLRNIDHRAKKKDADKGYWISALKSECTQWEKDKPPFKS